MKFPTEEPPANMRQMARTIRDMYVSLVNEGFTAAEALKLVGSVLQATLTAAEVARRQEAGDE